MLFWFDLWCFSGSILCLSCPISSHFSSCILFLLFINKAVQYAVNSFFLVCSCRLPGAYSSSSFPLVLSGNADGNCYSQAKPSLLQIQLLGFQSYSSFSFVFLAIMMGLCFSLGLTSYTLDSIKISQRLQQTQTSLRNLRTSFGLVGRFSSNFLLRQSMSDKKCALEHLGEGSVYSFFLGETVVDWLIALVTVSAQVWMVSNTSFFTFSFVLAYYHNSIISCSPLACSVHQSCRYVC